METVVVVANHRNQHQSHGRNRGNGSSKGGSFCSALTGHFRGISCRTFQPGSGLLPPTSKSYSMNTPVSKQAFASSFSPKTPSPAVKINQKRSKRNVTACTYQLPVDIKFEDNQSLIDDEFHFYERWAGPTYSNSPPPSSLPIPTFSLQPKQYISPDSAASTSEIDLQFTVESMPNSPARKHISLTGDIFDRDDSATKTLRRILNLDITDN